MNFTKFKDYDSHLTVFEAEDVENKKTARRSEQKTYCFLLMQQFNRTAKVCIQAINEHLAPLCIAKTIQFFGLARYQVNGFANQLSVAGIDCPLVEMLFFFFGNYYLDKSRHQFHDYSSQNFVDVVSFIASPEDIDKARCYYRLYHIYIISSMRMSFLSPSLKFL